MARPRPGSHPRGRRLFGALVLLGGGTPYTVASGEDAFVILFVSLAHTRTDLERTVAIAADAAKEVTA